MQWSRQPPGVTASLEPLPSSANRKQYFGSKALPSSANRTICWFRSLTAFSKPNNTLGVDGAFRTLPSSANQTIRRCGWCVREPRPTWWCCTASDLRLSGTPLASFPLSCIWFWSPDSYNPRNESCTPPVGKIYDYGFELSQFVSLPKDLKLSEN